MNVFSRLFRIGTAEAHSAIDKLEDPIKMTEQGIRDLKLHLDESLKAFAEVKALSIRSRNDMETNRDRAKDYENKAILLLKKAESGEISSEEADRLATEALTKKEECVAFASDKQREVEKFDQNIAQLDANIKKLRSQISTYENELRTLKARVKVSKATKNINKQMAQIDSGSTISMLEKMKEKVNQEEALAEAYGDIATESKSLDDEIDSALGGTKKAEASESLAKLKEKLAAGKKEE
ncbi:PspA/IM30 family protein [Carboxylicivirga caseinilyticus]|uniref:PspA/IM30 family protein n=1 Tax=Carboxylicivirga caseinilyticus TaxID=3417572 RepID=UPI003D3450E6|nr:PspA/IM30 family protein [Marinilabiliaceae bacterium A049]